MRLPQRLLQLLLLRLRLDGICTVGHKEIFSYTFCRLLRVSIVISTAIKTRNTIESIRIAAMFYTFRKLYSFFS